MQKLFYCVYIKSDKEKLGTFIENMLTNIVESVQNSSDETASFMYLFDTNRQAVVGMYSAEKTQKLPAALTMYVNSLNSEAQMMGAIFEDIDNSSSDFERTRFTQVVSQNIPSSINTLTSILGTKNINENKPKVSDSESTTDLLAKISEILPQDGVEEETNTEETRIYHLDENNHGEIKSQELVLLGEILDKLNVFTSTLTDISNRLGRVEEKLDIIKSQPNESELGSVLGKQKAEEINSIGGIPEVPTYQDEQEEKQETIVIEEKPVEEPKPEVTPVEVNKESDVEKLVDEAHKENIAEGSEVATPNEVSIAETQAPSPEDEQSVNGATATIVDTTLTPEIKGGETEDDVVTGTESVEVKFDIPELNDMSRLLGLTDGTESSLHNYIISNRNSLSDIELDLYCKYDFEESIKQNKLVELDRVTSIKRKLETDRL